MYCIVSECKLRQSEYRGKFWRGALLNIKAVHTEEMPFIVCAIPSNAFGSLGLNRLIQYMNYVNRERMQDDDSRAFMLCKAMGTANGVTYQIVARGDAGQIRDDGEFPQRRMSLIAPEQVADQRLSYFNEQTRQVLATRSAPVDEQFDALSMFYQNPALRFNAAEFNKFKRELGHHYETERDLETFRTVIAETYE